MTLTKCESTKEYYETFKNQLTDSDFSDCEILELSDEEPTEEEEEFYFETIEEIFIEEYENDDSMALEQNEDVKTDIELDQDAKLAPPTRRPQGKQSQATSSASKVKKIFSQPARNQPKKKLKLCEFPGEFQCHRCGKQFTQKTHLNQHSSTQCDRFLTFKSRQSSTRNNFNH